MCIRDRHIPNVKVDVYTGLLAEYAHNVGACTIIKGPVSYTHLDVYKRQASFRTVWTIISKNSAAEPDKMHAPALPAPRAFLCFLGSVSYTHLDVYKRQERGRRHR